MIQREKWQRILELKGLTADIGAEPVPQDVIDAYRGIFPETLLRGWQADGWCGYGQGLFWTVNPQEYDHLIEPWLAGTPLAEIDRYHVFARTAFGDLYAWGEKHQCYITIYCATNYTSASYGEVTSVESDPEFYMESALSGATLRYCDCKDENGEGLFERALERLGPLAPHEGYGFVPALCAGGQAYLENLQKLDMRIHLDILKQLDSTPPKLPFWGMSFNYD